MYSRRHQHAGAWHQQNETVMANPPPRLSRESQRWVLQKYSFGHEHITEEWLDAMMRVAALLKYQEAVRKMEEVGLKTTRFLPHLARQKDETLGIIRDRGLGKPTLLAWSYQDPTATINSRVIAPFTSVVEISLA